jgi:hypothetical protein
MLAYCTYCSADKHYSEKPLPAIQLYNSERITKVFEAANKSSTTFLILSGKYGILSPNEKISYYDQLLTSSEVENHSDLIASQIKSKNITSIEFYMNSVERDKNLQSYVDCISIACSKLSIPLKISIVDFQH